MDWRRQLFGTRCMVVVSTLLLLAIDGQSQPQPENLATAGALARPTFVGVCDYRNLHDEAGHLWGGYAQLGGAKVNVYLDRSFPFDRFEGTGSHLPVRQWIESSAGLMQKFRMAGSKVYLQLYAEKEGHQPNVRAEVLLRDVADQAQLRESLESSENRDGHPYTVLICGPDPHARGQIFEAPNALESVETIKKATVGRNPLRCAFFNKTILAVLGPSDAVEKRERRIREFATVTSAAFGGLGANPDWDRLRLASGEFDHLFRDLRDSDLVDDRLDSYYLQWSLYRSPPGQFSHESYLPAKDLRANLMRGSHDNECTVSVFTTRGQGAEIRYSKTDKRRFSGLGQSVVTADVEKADYYFESYRNGKKTGETQAPEHCINATHNVTIEENVP